MKSLPIERAGAITLTGVIVLVAAPLVWHVPAWVSAVFFLAMSLRLAADLGRARLPPRWVVACGGLAVTLTVLATLGGVAGRDAGVALLMGLAPMKLLETRTRRDGEIVMILAAFLAVGVLLHSQSLLTGLHAFAAIAAILFGLATLAAPGLPPAARARRVGLLMLQGLPIGVLLFVVFPRLPGPLWGIPQQGAAVTGLSDRMAPGSIAGLVESDAVAFRATLTGSRPAELYWRGPVLTDFDGRTWTIARVFRHERLEGRGAPVTQEILIEPYGGPWLFALDRPQSVTGARLFAERVPVAPGPVRERTRYVATSYPEGVLDPREPEPSALALPAGFNPRARGLAQSWRRETTDPAALVARALGFLRQGRFVYTLEPAVLGRHSVDEFLFDSRAGFCEHYASAFVFLLRAAGVPARVVTGYLGGTTNAFGDWITVRQNDAHAWAEAWLPGHGWVRVDPTAAAAPVRVSGGLAAALPDAARLPALMRIDARWALGLRDAWEGLSGGWARWVVGYDRESQIGFLTRAGLDVFSLREMAAVLAAVLLAPLALLAAWASRPGLRRRADPAARMFRRFIRRAGRLGVRHRPADGPLAFAERIALKRPEVAGTARAFAAAYAELRYAGRGDLDALRSRLKEFLRR